MIGFRGDNHQGNAVSLAPSLVPVTFYSPLTAPLTCPATTPSFCSGRERMRRGITDGLLEARRTPQGRHLSVSWLVRFRGCGRGGREEDRSGGCDMWTEVYGVSHDRCPWCEGVKRLEMGVLRSTGRVSHWGTYAEVRAFRPCGRSLTYLVASQPPDRLQVSFFDRQPRYANMYNQCLILSNLGSS